MQKRTPGSHSSSAAELRHFTNRESEQATFRRLVNLPAGSNLPVLMFYGVGGNGKSWLLRKLRELLESIPSARLDLDPNPGVGGTSFHTDSSRALAEIRRQLDVECPRFDLAYAMIRFKEGAGNDPLFSHGASGLAWEFIEQAAQTVASFPGGNILLWLSKKAGSRLKDTALGEWLLSNAGNDDFLRLRRLDRQDIYPLLAERLAIDLEERLPPRPGKACQAVVFLDTFEALQRGIQSEAHQKEREAWVRELYQKLTNVLLVIAGRDRLDWDELDPDWQMPEHLEQHLVGGLSRHDAETFLGRCGIGPGPLRDAVLRVSHDTGTSEVDAYHPYSLGLCVDTIANERAQDRQPEPATFALSPGDSSALAERFLRSLPDRGQETWVIRLAQTPRFDETAARTTFSPVSDVQQDAAWARLLDFSFLRRTTDPGWFTLHPRMLAALRQRLAMHPAELAHEHQRWREHWESRLRDETDEFAALAWCHLFQLNRSQAQAVWKERAVRARAGRRMIEHHRLLDWWSLTGIENQTTLDTLAAKCLLDLADELNEAALGDRAADLLRSIACLQAALTVLHEHDFPADWAAAQKGLGKTYFNLARAHDSAESLKRSIECSQAALRVFSEASFPIEWGKVQNNLGLAHLDLPTDDPAGNLQAAISFLQASLRVFSEARTPIDWGRTQMNLAVAYSGLARSAANRAQYLDTAIEYCQAALRVYTETDFPVDWAMVLSNLGLAYSEVPDEHGVNVSKAINLYETTLHVFDEAVFPFEWARVQHALGTAYSALPTGDRDQNLRKAIDCFQAALRSFTRIGFPGGWAQIHHGLGIAYGGLSAGNDAENMQRSIACFEAALEVFNETNFPTEWAGTQSNLAVALIRLGERGGSQNFQRALDCCNAALRVYTEAEFPEQWARTKYNLGTILEKMGRKLVALGVFHSASRGFRAAGLEEDARRAERRRNAQMS